MERQTQLPQSRRKNEISLAFLGSTEGTVPHYKMWCAFWWAGCFIPCDVAATTATARANEPRQRGSATPMEDDAIGLERCRGRCKS